MPTIQVPLTDYTDVLDLKRSKKFRTLANELISLKQQSDLIDERQAELRAEMYPILEQSLDESVKSVAYEGYRLTKIDEGTSARFSIDKMMQRKLKCHKCKSENHVTAVDVEACKEPVKRKATVQVAKIKNNGESDGE